MSPTFSRRAAMTAALLPAAAAQAASARPDADLLRFCAAAMAADAEVQRANDPSQGISDEESNSILRRWNAAFDAVVSLRARTRQGIRAKAAVTEQALRMMACSCADKPFDEDSELHERLAFALCVDIAALTGEAV